MVNSKYGKFLKQPPLIWQFTVFYFLQFDYKRQGETNSEVLTSWNRNSKRYKRKSTFILVKVFTG
jgi:hypothetical protein